MMIADKPPAPGVQAVAALMSMVQRAAVPLAPAVGAGLLLTALLLAGAQPRAGAPQVIILGGLSLSALAWQINRRPESLVIQAAALVLSTVATVLGFLAGAYGTLIAVIIWNSGVGPAVTGLSILPILTSAFTNRGRLSQAAGTSTAARDALPRGGVQ